ncbi:hypothetical protein L6252_03470 [Candidatus Parcubacteria bacterium]|nr:hypothetical protein [Candidatus Parcubacteria bacterium]
MLSSKIYESRNPLVVLLGLALAFFLFCIGYAILSWFILGIMFGWMAEGWVSWLSVSFWLLLGLFLSFRGLMHLVEMFRFTLKKKEEERIMFFISFIFILGFTLLVLFFISWSGWALFSDFS